MSINDDVISAMKEAGKPLGASEVAKILGADKAEVDKAFKELKAEGKIVSPVRCKWEPARDRGRAPGNFFSFLLPEAGVPLLQRLQVVLA